MALSPYSREAGSYEGGGMSSQVSQESSEHRNHKQKEHKSNPYESPATLPYAKSYASLSDIMTGRNHCSMGSTKCGTLACATTTSNSTQTLSTETASATGSLGLLKFENKLQPREGECSGFTTLVLYNPSVIKHIHYHVCSLICVHH